MSTPDRIASLSRTTSESSVELELNLDGTGVGAIMWLMAGVNVAGLLVTLTLGEETRGRSLTDTASAQRTGPPDTARTGPGPLPAPLPDTAGTGLEH